MARHFLTGEELTVEELARLVERALQLKSGRGSLLAGAASAAGEQPSTRTRVSFEVAVSELGGNAVVLREGEMQLTRGESLRDTALVLSRLVQGVGVRSGSHETLEELAAHATVPVVNLLTPAHHPTQALADLVTLRERFGELGGLRLAYVGDGNNVAASLIVLGAKAGLDVAVATPPDRAPPSELAEGTAATGRGSVALTADPREAAAGAHALYTDVWVSLGDESDAGARRAALAGYRLDESLLEAARPDAVVMHCLPAHPGEEISEELLHGERSAVWDQAENRLHAHKALLELLLARERPSLVSGR